MDQGRQVITSLRDYAREKGVSVERAAHEVNILVNKGVATLVMSPKRQWEEQMRMTPQEQELYARIAGPSDDQIVEAYIARRDYLAAKAKEFQEQMAPYEQQMAALEGEMMRRLLERSAKNTKTEHGVAYIERRMTVKTEDKMAMLLWAYDHFDEWGKDLLTAAVSKETLNLYIEKTKDDEHPNGTVPPGINITYNDKVVFRKG